jgi:glutaredoxin
VKDRPMMDYLLFSYPNCMRCDVLKETLASNDLNAKEFNLVQKESKLKIREYLKILKRDEKGGIIIPTLIIRSDMDIAAVINEPKELEDWLTSKG